METLYLKIVFPHFHFLRTCFITILIAVLSVVQCDKRLYGTDAGKLLTRALFQNINSDEKASGKYCWYKFLLEESLHDSPLIDWNQVREFSEPLQYFYEITNSSNSANHTYISPTARFKSTCWHIVITVKSPKLKKLNLKIGHATLDHYVFLSSSESVLSLVMSSPSVLNSFARKYGIYLDSILSSVGYLTEPPYYTGQLISQSTLEFRKYVNTYNGRKLRAAYLLEPPNFFEDSDSHLDGLQFRLIMEIARITNHSLAFYADLRTPGFGRRLSNGSWTGLVGEMMSGRADMVTTISPTFERLPFMDPSRSTYILPMVMCLQSPQPHRQWHALIDPLTSSVWVGIFVTFILAIGSFTLKELLFGKATESWKSKCANVILDLQGVFLEQASSLRDPSKFLLILWIIFSYLLGTAYKSNLVSFLTFLKGDPVPESFTELSENPTYFIILHSVGGHELRLLKDSRNPVFRKIGERIVQDRVAFNCLQTAAQSKTVCIGWQAFLVSAMGEDTEEKLKHLFMPKNWGTWIWVGVAFRKGSIFRDVFDRYIEMVRGSHLLNHWKEMCIQNIKMENRKKAEKKRNQMGESLDEQPKSERDDKDRHVLNISDVFLVFVLSGVGILLAFLCFVSELFQSCIILPTIIGRPTSVTRRLT